MPGIVRASKILLLVLVLAVLLLLGMTLSVLIVFGRGFQTKARSRCMMLGSRAISRILGLRIDAASVPAVSKSMFIVSNHCSYLDIYVLGSLFPAVFIAKQEVRAWPVIGRLARFAGTYFVNRDSRMSAVTIMDDLKQLMNSGVPVVVFPEATTTDGFGVKDFKTPLFKLPLELKIPVLPVSLMYSHIDSVPIDPDMQDRIAWYGDMGLLPHLWNVLAMGQIRCRVLCGSLIEGVMNEDASAGRKMLAVSARNSVLKGLQRMRLEAAAAKVSHTPA
ncbi:MAG: lysophospholipid acyltransferase family protein [Thermodesulfovibrionales bacterium]